MAEVVGLEPRDCDHSCTEQGLKKWRQAMGVEQSRGAERPAGGPGSATAEGVSMQILSTEHWSLLATRSLGYTEFFSRANMFFSVLSGAVIALALIAQAGRFETFIAAAILLVAVTFFVGLATIAPISQLNYEDTPRVTGVNPNRPAYLEMDPDMTPNLRTP